MSVFHFSFYIIIVVLSFYFILFFFAFVCLWTNLIGNDVFFLLQIDILVCLIRCFVFDKLWCTARAHSRVYFLCCGTHTCNAHIHIYNFTYDKLFFCFSQQISIYINERQIVVVHFLCVCVKQHALSSCISKRNEIKHRKHWESFVYVSLTLFAVCAFLYATLFFRSNIPANSFAVLATIICRFVVHLYINFFPYAFLPLVCRYFSQWISNRSDRGSMGIVEGAHKHWIKRIRRKKKCKRKERRTKTN